MALSREERAEIVKEVVQQIVQTSGQFQSDKKVVGHTSVTEDTQTDEAIRGKSYNDSEMWAYNKKMLTASEQTERNRSLDYDRAMKQLEVAEKEHNLAVQRQLDAIQLSEARQAAIIKHMSNHLSLDYRATVNESQLPMVDDDITVGNLADKDEE